MRGSQVKMFAYAKINLALAVVGKRQDNYHDLESVMQSIDLHDIVHVKRQGAGLVCQCGELSGPQNIAYRAGKIFLGYLGKPEGIEIIIEKNIPLEAGLAGGSSDAAVTLLALNHLFDKPFSLEQLREMAGECGSDVPFCLTGGTMWVTGKGEKLEELPVAPLLHMVLVKPEAGVNTAEAYHRFSTLGRYSHLEREKWETVLRGGKVHALANILCNDLEQVSVEMVPAIAGVKTLLLEIGCLGALMSGSGSAVFGLVRDEKQASEVVHFLHKKGYQQVWQTRTVEKNTQQEI
ncbi:MAG: 4-(cytidine 5'-diphospho)-2-C-methyl-D-erythritol kinase [Desulfitobacteriaceae bacterium]